MSLTPGTRLGTYDILAPRGAGGMGEVYRAKDLRLGRVVAVKVLPAEVASSSDRLARFESIRVKREERRVGSTALCSSFPCLSQPPTTLYSTTCGGGIAKWLRRRSWGRSSK